MRTTRFTKQTGGEGNRRKILQFVRDFTQSEGYPPTLREIGEAVGLVG